jgi:hypothetical protein
MSWLLTRRIKITLTKERTKEMMMMRMKAMHEAHDGGEGHVSDGEENAEVTGENEDGCAVNWHIVIVTRTSCL